MITRVSRSSFIAPLKSVSRQTYKAEALLNARLAERFILLITLAQSHDQSIHLNKFE